MLIGRADAQSVRFQPARVRAIPAEMVEIDPIFGVKADALFFQALALLYGTRSIGARANHPPAVDHPLPGDVAAVGQTGQRIAYHARRTRSFDPRDLAVGRYPPARNLAHNRQDPLIDWFGKGRVRHDRVR